VLIGPTYFPVSLHLLFSTGYASEWVSMRRATCPLLDGERMLHFLNPYIHIRAHTCCWYFGCFHCCVWILMQLAYLFGAWNLKSNYKLWRCCAIGPANRNKGLGLSCQIIIPITEHTLVGRPLFLTRIFIIGPTERCCNFITPAFNTQNTPGIYAQCEHSSAARTVSSYYFYL
jgi:hypothetical protein